MFNKILIKDLLYHIKLKIKNINIKILNIIIIKNKKKFLLYVKTK